MKLRGYLLLTCSIVFEAFATTMLKASNGFTILLPSLSVVFGYGISFYCLSLCLKYLPLSLAYAVWSGVGTILTAFIGYIFWQEIFTPLKIIGILLIIGGVILLNTADKAPKTEVNLP